MHDFIAVVTPLLLHMIFSEVIVIIFGGRLDAASCTMAASAVVIPVAAWMYYRDCKSGRIDKCRDKDKVEESRKTKQKVVFGMGCFIFGGFLNLAWSGLLNLAHIQDVFSNQTQEALLAGEAAVQVVGLGILVPIAEELVFRALIYNRMKRCVSVKQAVILSALLFAVYHGNPIQMIFAFPMAVALAVVFERGKLFVFPLLFHMGANLTAIILNFFL